MEIIKTGSLKDVIKAMESDIEVYDMEYVKADSETNDNFLLADPIVFIPSLNLFAASMEYCLGDCDGMADWSGTMLFSIENMNEKPRIKDYYYESDDLIVSLLNYTQKDPGFLYSLYAGTFTGEIGSIATMLEAAILGSDSERELEREIEIELEA